MFKIVVSANEVVESAKRIWGTHYTTEGPFPEIETMASLVEAQATLWSAKIGQYAHFPDTENGADDPTSDKGIRRDLRWDTLTETECQYMLDQIVAELIDRFARYADLALSEQAVDGVAQSAIGYAIQSFCKSRWAQIITQGDREVQRWSLS